MELVWISRFSALFFYHLIPKERKNNREWTNAAAEYTESAIIARVSVREPDLVNLGSASILRAEAIVRPDFFGDVLPTGVVAVGPALDVEDPGEQLVGLRVDEEERRPVGVDQLLREVHDLGDQRVHAHHLHEDGPVDESQLKKKVFAI